MDPRKTINVGGSAVEVTLENWQTIARQKLSESPDLAPAARLGLFQAIQQLAGVANAPRNYHVDMNGAAVANDYGESSIINNPLVRLSDFAEGVERDTFGQGFVDFAHVASAELVARPINFLKDKLPAGAATAWDKLGAIAADVKALAEKLAKAAAEGAAGANRTVQIALVAAAVVAVVAGVYFVEKAKK